MAAQAGKDMLLKIEGAPGGRPLMPNALRHRERGIGRKRQQYGPKDHCASLGRSVGHRPATVCLTTSASK